VVTCAREELKSRCAAGSARGRCQERPRKRDERLLGAGYSAGVLASAEARTAGSAGDISLIHARCTQTGDERGQMLLMPPHAGL
jgi:hypothetical protein